MEQYGKFVFFSKKAEKQFDDADPQVKKAVMRIVKDNIQETKASIEREILEGRII